MLVAGCVPIPLGSDPSVDATLVDATTHRPIANCDVSIASVEEPDRISRTRTDAKGHVRADGIIRHFKCPFRDACDPIMPRGASVRISANGYESKDIVASPYELMHSSTPVAGEIELTPAKQD